MTRPAWWKGARGEWYVVVQAVLMVVVAVGPRSWNGWPPWPFPASTWLWYAGAALAAAGVCLAAAGMVKMGPALTALPCPEDRAVLLETGVYRLVRHPIYAGVITAAFGWALLVRGSLTMGCALALGLLLDVKSREEERWLSARFPGYADYQRRVRKLIPFLY